MVFIDKYVHKLEAKMALHTTLDNIYIAMSMGENRGRNVSVWRLHVSQARYNYGVSAFHEHTSAVSIDDANKFFTLLPGPN